MQLNLLTGPRSDLFTYLRHFMQRKKRYVKEYRQHKELRHILETESIHTYFQPIVELTTGKNIGYEIFNRPPVSPSFPDTENFYDFIGQTDYILFVEKICRRMSVKRFADRIQNQPSEQQSLIFLNVHPNVLTDLHEKSCETLELLQQHSIPPENVVFEISEKAAIEDYDRFEEILADYRSLGFRIALDDAGSGYNSLKTLVYLKPEFLKLDRTLIQHIDEDETKQQLVKLLLDFSNQSGIHLIAEGIERDEELAFLKEQGIHIGQGYAIGKPSQQLVSGTIA